MGRPLVAAIALMGLASCAGEGIIDPVSPPAACTDGIPFQPRLSCIQQFVFTPTCALAGCHAPPVSEGLDLSEGASHANLVGAAGSQVPSLNRVEPGVPGDSYLIIKLEGTDPRRIGERMPPGGPYLSQAEIDAIRQWILDGAPDN